MNIMQIGQLPRPVTEAFAAIGHGRKGLVADELQPRNCRPRLAMTASRASIPVARSGCHCSTSPDWMRSGATTADRHRRGPTPRTRKPAPMDGDQLGRPRSA